MSRYTEGHGAVAELAWADLVKSRGFTVIPTSALVHNTRTATAPMGESAGDSFALPDALVVQVTPGGSKQYWTEVKSKKRPGWLEYARRWEHGIDLLAYEHCLGAQAQTGIPVAIVIHECASPTDVRDPDSLAPSNLFLVVPLDTVRQKGRHEANWPKRGGVDSRDGRGGWLWPRELMCNVLGPCSCPLGWFDAVRVA